MNDTKKYVGLLSFLNQIKKDLEIKQKKLEELSMSEVQKMWNVMGATGETLQMDLSWVASQESVNSVETQINEVKQDIVNVQTGIDTIISLLQTHDATMKSSIRTTTDLLCQHEWGEDGFCTKCGVECNHKWVDGVCSVCGKTCTHEYDEAPYDYSCKICGKTNEAHVHEIVTEEITKEPTCTTMGTKAYKCADGTIVKSEYINSLGHDYEVTETNPLPTCTTEGSAKKICKRCNTETTDYVLPLRHNYVDGVCSVCGSKEAGLYDENGNMLASWYELEDNYGMYSHESDAEGGTSKLSDIINNNEALSAAYKLVVPEGVTRIKSYSFKGCTQLKELDLPSTIRNVGSYAFENCSSLEKIYIRSTDVTFGSGCFKSLKKSGAQYPYNTSQNESNSDTVIYVKNESLRNTLWLNQKSTSLGTSGRVYSYANNYIDIRKESTVQTTVYQYWTYVSQNYDWE